MGSFPETTEGGSYKFLTYYFSSSHVKIDVSRVDDLQTFRPSEAERNG